MNHIPPDLDRYRPPSVWLDAEQAAMLVGPKIVAAADVPVVTPDMTGFLADAQQ